MDRQFDEKIVAFLEKNKEAMFADVDRLLRINSVKGEPADGAPYGTGVREALEAALGICALHGLSTRCMDGRVGEAVYGSGEESLGIVTHVDIVPPGEGWTKPPLELTREGGMLFGRGVIDNKGPGVAALWALLAALHAGAVLRKRVVFLFGGDEESGMGDLKYYLEREKAPDIAFTPDGAFPAIHCEKTIVRFSLAAPLPEGSALLGIRGGTRVNVVPGEAEAALSFRPVSPLPEGVALSEAAEGWRVSAQGESAHASTPEKGDNAAVKLLGALKGLLPQGDPALPAISGLHACCAASNGSGLGIACADGESGPLTLNLGVLRSEGGMLYADCDIRHPARIDPDENIRVRLPQAAARAGLQVAGTHIDRGFCLPKEHPLVVTLVRIYNDITGSNEPPLAIGGGTYARMLPCAAAFGICFPGEEETAHIADERISEANFMLAARIYARAIAELAK